MAFELPKLNYAFDALEPNIDAKTMEIHYGKHHNGYTNNLNNIISGTEDEGKNIEEILKSLDLNNSGLRMVEVTTIIIYFGKLWDLMEVENQQVK